MKRLIILIGIILFCITLPAAPLELSASDTTQRTFTPQEALEAIIWVESGNNGAGAYNRSEPEAAGILQQFPIFVRDVNRIIGYEKYSLDDRYNDTKAIEMFWIYQNYYNPEMNIEKMARIWCAGPDGYKQNCSLSYWRLVNNRLNTVKL
jgi:hypothetical protein